MPSRHVHIHNAHRRIIQHISLEGLALDRDSADGTHRPEEPAHTPTPCLLLILSAHDGGRPGRAAPVEAQHGGRAGYHRRRRPPRGPAFLETAAPVGIYAATIVFAAWWRERF